MQNVETDYSLKVVRQVNYFIVPFVYQMSYGEAHKSKTREQGDWDCKDKHKARLFEHIDRLVTSENGYSETIGKRYVLKQPKRAKFGLPHNPDVPLTFVHKEEKFSFFIRDVELYLFETQVGFLAFKVEHDTNSIDLIVHGNYYIKKFLHQERKLFFQKTTSANVSDPDKESVNIGYVAAEMLHDLGIKTYFEKGQNNCPVQALVYNAVILDKSYDTEVFKEIIGRYLFKMRRSFKDSYQPAQSDYSLGSPEVLQLFQNSYWGASLEGVANLAFLVYEDATNETDAKTTNEYFYGTYFGHLSANYFYHYILTLHQRYALMNLTMMAAELPKTLEEVNKRTSSGNQVSVESLREKILFFTLRGSFETVTNITHQAKLYNFIRGTLHIQDLMNELHFELDALSNMAQMKAQEKKESFQISIVVFSFLFVVVSTLADGKSLIEGLPNLTGVDLLWFFILSACVVAAMLFAASKWYQNK